MSVGYISGYKKPRLLSELLAVACEYKGINFSQIIINSIEINKFEVEGYVYKNGEWNIKTLPLPKFIEISPFSFPRLGKDKMEFLRKNVILSDSGLNRFNKVRLQNKLEKYDSIKHIIIPTSTINTIEDVFSFLEQFNKIILKPIRGQFGTGVYSLQKSHEKYLLSYKNKVNILDENGVRLFLENEIDFSNYILQKFVNSFTKHGHPFDCRINVEKNGEGKWEIAKKFFRIGIGQKVVSNISKGGGVCEAKNFLDNNFDKMTKKLSEELNEIGLEIAPIVEEIRKTSLNSMGIDIGIEPDGKIYLYEVNSAPGTSQLRDRAALLRADYYEYILNKIKVEGID